MIEVSVVGDQCFCQILAHVENWVNQGFEFRTLSQISEVCLNVERLRQYPGTQQTIFVLMKIIQKRFMEVSLHIHVRGWIVCFSMVLVPAVHTLPISYGNYANYA